MSKRKNPMYPNWEEGGLVKEEPARRRTRRTERSGGPSANTSEEPAAPTTFAPYNLGLRPSYTPESTKTGIETGLIPTMATNPVDEDAYAWTQSYIESPKYRERLGNFWKYPDYIQRQRAAKASNVGFTENLHNSSAYVDNSSFPNQLNINPGQLQSLNANRAEVASHELGHISNASDTNPALRINPAEEAFILGRSRSVQAGGIEDLRRRATNFGSPNISNYLTDQKVISQQNHDLAPSEKLSDIQALRYLLNKNKIYDARTQDITPEQLQRAKQNKEIMNSFSTKRLLQDFDDQGLIDILNRVASNNNQSLPLAQDGTKLKPKQEAAYQSWRAKLPKPLQYEGDYDLRGLYLSNPKVKPSKNLHFPDTYKLPNHPTFSNESKYFDVSNRNNAGHWEETDSSWNYIPYNTNIKDTIVERKQKMADGGSVVNYLAERGQNYSFAARKKLFNSMFDGKYTGSAAQNTKLLGALKSNGGESMMEPDAPTKVSNPQGKLFFNNARKLKSYDPLSAIRVPQAPQSGLVVDKRQNMAYIMDQGSPIDSFPVLTGQNPQGEAATSYADAAASVNNRNTPQGYYQMSNKGIGQHVRVPYHDNVRRLKSISAYGVNEAIATPLAIHETADPAYRNKFYSMSPEQRYRSYGCVNCRPKDARRVIDKFTNDTVLVIDSDNPKYSYVKKQIQKNYGGKMPPAYEHGGFVRGSMFEDSFPNYIPDYNGVNGIPPKVYEQGGYVDGSMFQPYGYDYGYQSGYGEMPPPKVYTNGGIVPTSNSFAGSPFPPDYRWETYPAYVSEYPENGASSEYLQEAASGIRIKPENRGKFNATKKRTGKSTEELTHSKNPTTRKRAIFAQNAAKWNRAENGGGPYGDLLPVYNPMNIGTNLQNAPLQVQDYMSGPTMDEPREPGQGFRNTMQGIGEGINGILGGINFNTSGPIMGLGALSNAFSNQQNAVNESATQTRRNVTQGPIYNPYRYGTGSSALFANGGTISDDNSIQQAIMTLRNAGYDVQMD